MFSKFMWTLSIFLQSVWNLQARKPSGYSDRPVSRRPGFDSRPSQAKYFKLVYEAPLSSAWYKKGKFRAKTSWPVARILWPGWNLVPFSTMYQFFTLHRPSLLSNALSETIDDQERTITRPLAPVQLIRKCCSWFMSLNALCRFISACNIKFGKQCYIGFKMTHVCWYCYIKL